MSTTHPQMRSALGTRVMQFSGLLLAALMTSRLGAQVNVVTYHNDIARTGQNLNETTLTPGNVNPTQFGKLFSQPVNGEVFAQPLYVSQVAIPGQGTHNVVYVATTKGNPNDPNSVAGAYPGDSVYAFDADSNGGTNAAPLWQVSLASQPAAGTYTPNVGVLGTPVIDLSTKTIYVASSEYQGKTPIYRLHALNIATGAEKFGGPLVIQASVPGTGNGSVGGVLTFNPQYQLQRPGLLFLNGVVYIAFGSIGDQGAWHGWIFSYGVNSSTGTLQQLDAYCPSANGSGSGLWMGGAGLAAEVYSSSKPYGRMFVAMGNGSFSASAPYTPTMSYGMSLVDFDLTGGTLTVEDIFTPFNEATLDAHDGDLGSGGPVLLPTQTLASGKTLNPLVQIGKSGMFYILDRDNNTDGSNNTTTEYSPAGLGGFNTSGDKVVQEVQTPIPAGSDWGAGVWGSEAYWNNHIYSGGTLFHGDTGFSLNAFSFTNGVLSTAPVAQSAEQFTYPGPTPAISANGNTNAILWAVKTDGFDSPGPEALLAYDATKLGTALYSSYTNAARDAAGPPVEYAVPTIANGKVYVGAQAQFNVYGLFASAQIAPPPTFSPSSSSFATSVKVSISDAVAGATIYYTTDGSTPTTSSAIYQNPIVVSTNETITAIASATNYIQSASASATYQSLTTPATPVLSLAAGAYVGTQTLTITDTTRGATIYYTINGPAPTSASAVYTQSLTVSASEVVQAIAIVPGQNASAIASALYTIQPAGTINFTQGFTLADGPMQFNGSTDLDDFRLQLTNGGTGESGSAFYATPVNIQQFSTQFTFQLSNPQADGMTFTIQNVAPTARGGGGDQLGYGGIPKSIAIKFDLHNNAGEGPNSTGLYLDGAIPTVPAINLTGTGIDLHSGDYMNASITYDGTNLILTLTDALTLATWSNTFTVNIPSAVGGNTAYVGFTAGTGGLTASQKLTSWLYVPGPPQPNYPAGLAPASLTLNVGASLNGTKLELTDGQQYEARSAFYSIPVNVQQFITSFDFQIIDPGAEGFTFTIQGDGPTSVGSDLGNLGYAGIAKSVAVKFDLYSTAGEGKDSTGLYLNGAAPTVPSIDLTSTGINLHSGDIFNAQLTYNGTTLTVVITDTVTNASATQTYTVNIPATVGGPSAYVGFTGATGGLISTQEILNWSYSL